MVIRTPDQRVRVFVSSTMRELAAERRAVTAAITQLRLTPVLFELGARPYAPRDLPERQQALRAWQQLQGRAGMLYALAGLGEVAASGGQPHRADQLLGAAQALLPSARPLLRVTVPYDLPRRVAAARADGDPAAFDRGLAEGQDWTIDKAVAAGLASAAVLAASVA